MQHVDNDPRDPCGNILRVSCQKQKRLELRQDWAPPCGCICTGSIWRKCRSSAPSQRSATAKDRQPHTCSQHARVRASQRMRRRLRPSEGQLAVFPPSLVHPHACVTQRLGSPDLQRLYSKCLDQIHFHTLSCHAPFLQKLVEPPMQHFLRIPG